jgi:aryl-alcohol dehydrogenase-like predicted oxidoreductase
MEFATISSTPLTVSRIGVETWAIGGWMWGGTDEAESIKTIHAAVERGINLIDTPVDLKLLDPSKPPWRYA